MTLGNILNDLWHVARKGVLPRHAASIFWFRFNFSSGGRIRATVNR